MSQDVSQILADALKLPRDAVFYYLSRELTAVHPERFLLETEDYFFRLEPFADDGGCKVRAAANAHNEFEWSYRSFGREERREPYNNWREIEWKDQQLLIATVGLQGNHCRNMRHFVIGDSEDQTREFFR